MKILFCVLFVCFGSIMCHGQQTKLDSLLKLNADYRSSDYTKLNILNSLAEVYEWMQVDSGLAVADRAIVLGLQLNYQKGLADAYLLKVNLLHYKGKIKEREELLEKVLMITANINDKNSLAEYYLQLARIRQGNERLALSRKALEVYSQTNNALGIGRASFFLGRHVYSLSGGGIKDSTRYVYNARDIFQKLGNQPWLGFSWCEIGIQTDDNLKREEYAKNGLRIAQKENVLQVMGSAYFVLAINYMETAQHVLSLENWLKSLNIAEQVGSIEKQISVSGSIGKLLGDLGKDEESLKYTKKAGELAERAGLLSHLTSVRERIGMLYQRQHKYLEAREAFLQALKLSTITHEEYRTNEVHCFLAETELKLGNYKQAFSHLKSADSLAKKLRSNDNVGANLVTKALAIKNAPDALLIQEGFSPASRDQIMMRLLQKSLQMEPKNTDGLLAISDLYLKLGDNRNSLLYFKKYTSIKDTLAKAASANSLTSLQIDFEVEKKEAEIALLNKDNEMQSKELDKQKVVRNAFIGGFSIMLLFAGIFLLQRNKISKEKKVSEKEKERSDTLLLNILPAEVAEELKAKGTADAKLFDNVTVLFTDFKSFTTVSEQLSPQELVNELHACFKAFDEICTKYSIEKIKTIGDAYLAVCGLPLADEKHAENVVNAALEIREFMANRGKELGAKTFEIRIGINSGSVVAGIVGVKKFAYDIWGDTVNTAARMEQNSEAGKINISETTYALVKNQFTCEFRGEIDAKNKGKLTMYFVEKKL